MVIFCFSKNRCDKSADNLRETDLTSRSEKSEIRVFCDKAFSRLKGSDRNLPQVPYIIHKYMHMYLLSESILHQDIEKTQSSFTNFICQIIILF